MPPEAEAWSCNHWTAGEFASICVLIIFHKNHKLLKSIEIKAQAVHFVTFHEDNLSKFTIETEAQASLKSHVCVVGPLVSF